MPQNVEDGGNRSFVFVQLPDPTGNSDFETIPGDWDRTYTTRIEEDTSRKASLLEDLGIQAFKLSRSCSDLWNGGEAKVPMIKT